MIRANLFRTNLIRLIRASRKRSGSLPHNCRTAPGSYSPPKRAQTRALAQTPVAATVVVVERAAAAQSPVTEAGAAEEDKEDEAVEDKEVAEDEAAVDKEDEAVGGHRKQVQSPLAEPTSESEGLVAALEEEVQ